jgi:RNA polymerase sigma factor (sigma-70 family)
VEASALPTRLTAGRAPISAAFLRLRSDEQLVALFRAGSDDAFRAIHDRYGARLLAYTRQMLRGGGDAEDALQDVFIRAYRALRSNDRPVTLRAWLYRIAHNRCIDELRRPHPLPSELAADAEPAFGCTAASREPPAVAERSAALARLVADVRTLPSQQRSALLMRELQGLSYEELASAMAISVPAVKSLLLRARTGMIDIAAARDTPCAEIRDELICAADRSVRVSGRARRHCGECADCEAYRGELKRVRRGFAALTPSGPLTQLGLLLGFGGAGGSGGGGAAAAGGGAAASAGGGAAAGSGVLAGVTVTKVAVAVCCAALLTTAGRAVIAPAPPVRSAPVHSSAMAAGTAGVLTPNRLIAVPTAAGGATSGSPTPSAPLGKDGGAAATLGPPAATGVSGTTGAAGAAAHGSSGSTGAIGSPAGSTGATGTTGPSPVSGIGGPASAAASSGGPELGNPAGATGATGESGSTLTSDEHGDTGKSQSPTGASGAIGASATIAAAPGSPAGG